MPKQHDIRSLDSQALKEYLQENGEKAFRAKQIEEWLWVKGARSFEEMTNLSKALREKLQRDFTFHPLQIAYTQESSDGTRKVAFRTHDSLLMEGVLIPSQSRLTACLSSQIGCNLDCAFCATGKMGFRRNLTGYEMFEHFLLLQGLAEKHHKMQISNIVFMGMGEPLLNYENLKTALHRITDPKGYNMSPTRITVSTAGITRYLRALGEDFPTIQLAVSLHSANPSKRTALMPVNKANGFAKLTQALKGYHEATGNRITFEYLMLKAINDEEEDALELAEFCKNFPVKINLITYNPVPGIPYEPSKEAVIRKFREILEKRNLIVNVRQSKGQDVDAACGQLANRKK